MSMRQLVDWAVGCSDVSTHRRDSVLPYSTQQPPSQNGIYTHRKDPVIMEGDRSAGICTYGKMSDPTPSQNTNTWGHHFVNEPAQVMPAQRPQLSCPQQVVLAGSSSVCPSMQTPTSNPSPTPTPVTSEPSLSMMTTAASIGALQCSDKGPRQTKKELSEVVSHDVAIPEMTLIEAGLQIQRVLGCGNQSSVHLASKIFGGSFSFSCIKRFAKAACTQSSLHFLKEEYRVTKEVGSHPCITQALQIFQDASFFYIELALYQGGDFTNLKKNAVRSGASCDEEWWIHVFRQAMRGLAHLHAHSFMHCDVKEPNLMLKTNNYHQPEVVLIDFGIVQAADAKRTAIFGTPGYIAPEVWDTKIWTPQGDAFSLGVVILQTMIDKVPDKDRPRCGVFTENTETFKDIKIATQTRDPQMSSNIAYGVRLEEVTTRLLKKVPAQRPSVSEALIFLEIWRGEWISSVINRL